MSDTTAAWNRSRHRGTRGAGIGGGIAYRRDSVKVYHGLRCEFFRVVHGCPRGQAGVIRADASEDRCPFLEGLVGGDYVESRVKTRTVVTPGSVGAPQV